MNNAVSGEIPHTIQAWLVAYQQRAELGDDWPLLSHLPHWADHFKDSDWTLIGRALKNLEPLAPDPETVAATVLFALPETLSIEELGWDHPPETLAGLLAGLRRVDYFGRTYASTDDHRAEGLRRLLLALIADVRVLLIILAWQWSRLQVARRLPTDEREAIAEETRLIYAPLANRLGIWQLKWPLEDLAFQYLEPKTYQRIRRLVAEQREEREGYIQRFIDQLLGRLQEAYIQAEVTGRPKHLYSIWRKMQRKGLDFNELFDVRAVRVLVPTVADCYTVLGLVHTHWQPVPGEFDDYISNPKANLYQSLHTAVVGQAGRVIEVQIRTIEMHQHAELGVAAHWRYKEGGPRDAQLEKRIGMMRQLFEGSEHDDQVILEGFESLSHEDRVYVLTPTGEVKDLVGGSTPLDFAYLIHTEVGHRCRGARVNGRIVPLTTVLANGDRVEILTGKEARPSRDWMVPRLGYIRSARARAKVRAWFKQAHYDDNLVSGRQAIEAEFRRLDLSMDGLADVMNRFNVHSVDEVYAAIGRGDLTTAQVARAVERQQAPETPIPQAVTRQPSIMSSGASQGVQIEGVGQLMHHIARCCQPVPGDHISGYITRGRGVSIHRSDCKQMMHLQRQQPERVLEVSWRNEAQDRYLARVVIEAWDRRGLIKDIGTVLATEQANIASMEAKPQPEPDAVTIELLLRVSDFEQLANLLGRLQNVSGVLSARRFR